MPKPRTAYVCQQCGYQASRWMGRCPECNAWDSLVETPLEEGARRGTTAVSLAGAAQPQSLTEISTDGYARMIVPMEEFNRVLGGGIVPGSLVLISGDPGIGKCVTGDTRVLNPESGAYLPITEWATHLRSVLAVDEQTLQLAPTPATAFLEQGRQPIVEVKTRLGRTLRCTPTHPLLTVDGWRPAGELLPGHRIAAVNLAEALPDLRLRALGYGDVYWDEIVSVTPAGEAPVYDLCVPERANFCANDLIVHNSTLLTQVTALIAERGDSVLYVSAEESAQQVKLRAGRLGHMPPSLYVLSETNLDRVLQHIEKMNPALVIVDSIQSVYLEALSSAAGSVSQVREGAAVLMRLAKERNIPIFLVGHVTKTGAIAGPRVLEHIVDAVLYLEGDRFHQYRLLRGVKNRFGSTFEVGVFEMGAEGMVEVDNPSAAFLSERSPTTPGSTVVVTMEGTRPILVEVQALTSTTSLALPRRTANGIETGRLLMLTAVLSKRVGLTLGNQDIYVNVVGGMHISEPAADLGVAVAIASVFRNVPVDPEMAMMGEIGLSGELRSVAQLERRILEASKLGFKRTVYPRGARKPSIPEGFEAIGVRSVGEALEIALQR